MGLVPARTALVCMDFQNYGLHPDGYWAKQGLPEWPSGAMDAVAQAAKALDAARRGGVFVVHVGAAWREGSPEMNLHIPVFARGPARSVEGTWGAEFYDPVKPLKGEVTFHKRGIASFAGTELDRLLRVRDVNTLVLAGVATNWVVEGTAREGVDRGFRVIVLEDCCASVTRELHEFAVRRIMPEFCEVWTGARFARELAA